VDTFENADKLRRTSFDRMVAGVAGGLARTLGVDSSWIRLAFVLTSLIWGFGIAAYAVLWVLLPEDADEDEGGESPPLLTTRPVAVAGVALLALGFVVIAIRLAATLSLWVVLAALLVGAGAFLLARREP
jgi:phage shock protein PspC (stress-responsive transcriptional regulator)